MFDLGKLIVYYWCYKQEKFLQSIERYVNLNFNYFHNVRANNPLRQKIGLDDFTTYKMPYINERHKDLIIMGNSTYVFNKLLEHVNKEREKLIRFKKIQINKKNNTNQTGRILFNNANKKLSIKSF